MQLSFKKLAILFLAMTTIGALQAQKKVQSFQVALTIPHSVR